MSAQLINILQQENVDWDAFELQIKKCCKKRGDMASLSNLLLAAMKKSKNIRADIILHLAPLVKVKTLMDIFACSSSIKVKEAVLDEVNLTTSLSEVLIKKALKWNDVEAIHLIHRRNSVFLSKNFYRHAFGKYDAFDELCKVLISQDLLQNDLVFGSHMLHAAAYHGHVTMLNLVLDRFPKTLSQRDKHGNIPLHYACENQQMEAASILLRKGLDDKTALPFKYAQVGGLLVRNKRRKSALHLLRGPGSDGNGVKLAVSLINTLDFKTKKDYFSFINSAVNLTHLVAQHGDLVSMEILLRANPNFLRWKNQLFKRPMSVALMCGHFEVAAFMYKVAKEEISTNPIKFLNEAIVAALDGGVDLDLLFAFVQQIGVSFSQLHGCWLLHHVAAKGSVQHASFLVKISPQLPSKRDGMGSLPIHLACREMNLDVLNYLLCCAREDDSFPYYYGGLFNSDCSRAATPIKSLLVAFNDVDENISKVSKCIAACMDVFPDLPILHYIIAEKILDVSMVDEFIRIFNPNPTVKWIDDKTALLLAIDAYKQCPSEHSVKLLDIILSHHRTCRDKNHIAKRQGRNPLHYSVDIGLKWDPVVKMLVNSDYMSLFESDLNACCSLPFMLAASKSDLNVLYCLVRTEPSCLQKQMQNV